MKTVFLAVSLALTLAALPAMAADEQKPHGDDHKMEAGSAAMHAGRGKVVAVNSQAGTVRLTHDPIKSLKWPKMTMDFQAHEATMLKDIKPGALVDFELMKMDGAWHIMRISPSVN